MVTEQAVTEPRVFAVSYEFEVEAVTRAEIGPEASTESEFLVRPMVSSTELLAVTSQVLEVVAEAEAGLPESELRLWGSVPEAELQ
jgi:hypothetical protein